MKCFLGRIGRWNHDITGGTPIKRLSLKIHLSSTCWLDMEDFEKSCLLVISSWKHKIDAGKWREVSIFPWRALNAGSFFKKKDAFIPTKMVNWMCFSSLFECPHEIMWLNIFFFFGKDVSVKLKVVPRRDQLEVSSSLINVPHKDNSWFNKHTCTYFLSIYYFFKWPQTWATTAVKSEQLVFMNPSTFQLTEPFK